VQDYEARSVNVFAMIQVCYLTATGACACAQQSQFDTTAWVKRGTREEVGIMTDYVDAGLAAMFTFIDHMTDDLQFDKFQQAARGCLSGHTLCGISMRLCLQRPVCQICVDMFYPHADNIPILIVYHGLRLDTPVHAPSVRCLNHNEAISIPIEPSSRKQAREFESKHPFCSRVSFANEDVILDVLIV
jgi:hypothetical protein